MPAQRRRSSTFRRAKPPPGSRKFDYSLDYKRLDLRACPELYRVGVGEQGVLLVEPYKSEILPHWRFRTPVEAKKSAATIYKMFLTYKKERDFVGMDMARKFLQMGFTRARRYANHSSGRKYDRDGKVLPKREDSVKAEAAAIFFKAWKRAEADRNYAAQKAAWADRVAPSTERKRGSPQGGARRAARGDATSSSDDRTYRSARPLFAFARVSTTRETPRPSRRHR